MQFAFTEEQQLLQPTVRQFALEKLLPHYASWDRGERFAKATLKELAALNRTTQHSYTQAASCEVSVGVERAACSAATAAVTSGV